MQPGVVGTDRRAQQPATLRHGIEGIELGTQAILFPARKACERLHGVFDRFGGPRIEAAPQAAAAAPPPRTQPGGAPVPAAGIDGGGRIDRPFAIDATPLEDAGVPAELCAYAAGPQIRLPGPEGSPWAVSPWEAARSA